MRKLLLVLMPLFIPFCVQAQDNGVVIRPEVTEYKEFKYKASGYEWSLDGDLAFGSDGFFRMGGGLSTTHGYVINGKVFLGASVGADCYLKQSKETETRQVQDEDGNWYEETYHPIEETFVFLPLAANVRWYVDASETKGKPFVSFSAGYSPFLKAKYRNSADFKHDYEYSGGINASVIGGVSFWGEKNRINAGAGYKFQGYEMTGSHRAIHSFVISLGISFR